MHRLQSVISEHTQTLVSIVECTAELDWYVDDRWCTNSWMN